MLSMEKLISGSSFWCHCPGAFIRRLCKPSLSCCFHYSRKLFLCKIRVVETDSRLSTWPIPRQISKSSCTQPDLAFVLNIHLQRSFPLKDASSILWEFPTTYFDHVQPLPQTIPRSAPALCSFKTKKSKNMSNLKYIFLDVWPSIGAWSTYQALSKKIDLSLSTINCHSVCD